MFALEAGEPTTARAEVERRLLGPTETRDLIAFDAERGGC